MRRTQKLERKLDKNTNILILDTNEGNSELEKYLTENFDKIDLKTILCGLNLHHN